MPVFTITYRKSAARQLQKMQTKKAASIRATMQRIAAKPEGKHANLKPLTDVKNGYRLRVGGWRVSYVIGRAAETLEVFEIAPRGGAYR